MSAHAQPVLDLMWAQWRPDRGQSFVVTHGSAEGNVLKLQVTYVARGANGTDVRRRVERTLDKTGIGGAGEFKVWKV